jgi:hypothetical protein
MDFEFKDAIIGIGSSCNDDIVLRCVRTRDKLGNNVEPRAQTPTIVSMDNHTAYKFAMAILNRIEVEDNRGSR